MDTCSACNGKGVRVIRLGHPNSPSPRYSGPLVAEGKTADGGIWQQYKGSGYSNWQPPYCVYPPQKCGACRGTGKRPSRDNRVAGMRIHLDADGWNTRRSAIAEGNEPYGIYAN